MSLLISVLSKINLWPKRAIDPPITQVLIYQMETFRKCDSENCYREYSFGCFVLVCYYKLSLILVFFQILCLYKAASFWIFAIFGQIWFLGKI